MSINYFYVLYLILLAISFFGIIGSSSGWTGFLLILPANTIICLIIFITITIKYSRQKKYLNIYLPVRTLLSLLILLTTVILINQGDNGDTGGSANFFQRVFTTGYSHALIPFPLFFLTGVLYYIYFTRQFFLTISNSAKTSNPLMGISFGKSILLIFLYIFSLVLLYFATAYAINDKRHFQGNYFVGLRGGIYYNLPRSNYGGGFVQLVGADQQTLRILATDSYSFDTKDQYAVNHETVYFRGSPLPNADPQTFRTIALYGIDKNNLFLNDRPFNLKQFQIDPSTFTVVTGSPYYKDQGQVYYINLEDQHINILSQADPATFTYLQEGYAKDDDQVFCKGEPLTDLNVHTFRKYTFDEVAGFEQIGTQVETGEAVYNQVGGYIYGDGTHYVYLCKPIHMVYPKSQIETYLQKIPSGNKIYPPDYIMRR